MSVLKATLAGCGALALWAFLALLSRLTAPVPPLQATALALAVGGVLGLGVAAARGRLGVLRQPGIAWAHGVGGLFGYHALYFAALALAPAVQANLLNYLWPLLMVLLAKPILGLPLGPRRLLGVGLGLAGCALLLGEGAEGAAPGMEGEGAALGLACAVGAAVVWGTYSVTARRLSAVPTEAVAGFCLAAALLAGVAHLLFEPTAPMELRQWLAVLLLGLGPMGAAFFLWDIGTKRGDPRLLGTLAYAIPVASTLLLVVAGEGVLTAGVVVAAALVAGGGALAASAADGRPKAPVAGRVSGSEA